MVKAEYIFDRLLKLHKSADVPEFARKTVRYSIDYVGISDQTEDLFHRAAARFSMLSYGMAWEHTLSNSSAIPSPSKPDAISFRFHDFDGMESGAAKSKNAKFSAWLSGQILRDLSEYLAFHLLDIYEVCLLVSLNKGELTEDNVTAAKKKVQDFERNSLGDRLKRLLKEFGIKVPFKEAILSLYDARNIFAHSDGIVEKRYCDKRGQFRIQWPANKHYLIERDTGKKIPYHRVRKPFLSNKYARAQIAWLSKAQSVTYAIGDKISLENQAFEDLIFFYFYVAKDLQVSIADFCTKSGVLVTPPASYCGCFSWRLIGEDIPVEVSIEIRST